MGVTGWATFGKLREDLTESGKKRELRGSIKSHPQRPCRADQAQGLEARAWHCSSKFLSPCSRPDREHRVGTHPIGIRQSLAFFFSTKREVMFPGFPLSAMDMDSTLRRRTRRSLADSIPCDSCASDSTGK